VLGFGLACTFHWHLFGSGDATECTSSYGLGYLDYGPWGGHLNSIHFSQEKGVAEISSLIGFFYEPTCSWLGVGSTNALGDTPMPISFVVNT